MAYSIINNISPQYVPDWGNDKKYIAIHYLGCVGENYELAQDGTGAHFTVFYNGEIHQRCDLNAVIWAVGTGGYYTQKHPKANNYNTISIEMCVRKTVDRKTQNLPEDKDWYFTEDTQLATVWLVKKLLKELDIPITNVLRHYDIVNKVCPAPYVHNNSYKSSWTWTEFINYVKGKELPEGITQPKTIKNAHQLYGYSEVQKIDILAPYYQKVANETGLLASVGLAQFCLESGYGTTVLAEKCNNLHGMKCELSGNTWSGSTWDGINKYSKSTIEHDKDGNPYYIIADFRVYDTVEDSIRDRAMYLLGAMDGKKKRYPNIDKCKTAQEQIQCIKDGGYATDVNYVNKIMDIINRYNLTQYDQTGKEQEKPDIAIIYRVQVGFYVAKARAKAFTEAFKRLYHVDAIYREKENGYMIQAGAFTSEQNAKNRVAMLKSMYNVDSFYYKDEV